MFYEPLSQLGFTDFTGGDSEKSKACILLTGGYCESVVFQENECNLHRGSLIPVHEGMIAGDSDRIGRRKIRHGYRIFGIRKKVLGASQGRVKQPSISKPV